MFYNYIIIHICEVVKHSYFKGVYFFVSPLERTLSALFTPFVLYSQRTKGLKLNLMFRFKRSMLLFLVCLMLCLIFDLIFKSENGSRAEWSEQRVEFPLAKARKNSNSWNGVLSLSFRSHCGLRVRFFHCLLLQPFREISFCPWFYTIVPISEVPPAQFSFFIWRFTDNLFHWRQFEKPHSNRRDDLLLMLAHTRIILGCLSVLCTA